MINSTFDKIYELYDMACTIYKKEKQTSYLDALIGVTNLITNQEEIDSEDDSFEDVINSLSLFDDFDTMQAVFLLLMAKGFKSSSYKLDLIVPGS